jgi:epoxyqueuosine reductase
MGHKTDDIVVITRKLKQSAFDLGFSQVGICPAVPPPGLERFHEWLDRGYAGEMTYLPDRRSAYADPGSVLNGARSIVMLTLDYGSAPPQTPAPGQGQISRYAWGEEDYHDVIHGKLKALRQTAETLLPGQHCRGVVDTAPLLERDYARMAGLGWQGKNTLLLSRTGGSWFFLAALLLDIELAYDQPFAPDHCGTCTACLDACPTQAFPEPGVLDARRFISYLTIELRGPIPTELRSGMGSWMFGCDICQEVCPWQSKSRISSESWTSPQKLSNPVDLLELFKLDDAAFRARFRKTPLWRTRRIGILRNAAIVLGNQKHEPATDTLIQAWRTEAAIVRGAAIWALGEIGTSAAIEAVKNAADQEQDDVVRQEIGRVLSLQP